MKNKKVKLYIVKSKSQVSALTLGVNLFKRMKIKRMYHTLQGFIWELVRWLF